MTQNSETFNEKSAGEYPADSHIHVASVDPGETTGYILYCLSTGRVIHAISGSIEQIFELLQEAKPAFVVLERFPYDVSDLPSNVYEGYAQILSENECKLIFPSTWKPLAKAQKWNAQGNIHVQDAWNMLRYYMLLDHQKEIGDGKFNYIRFDSDS